jgi:hypothetical protein
LVLGLHSQRHLLHHRQGHLLLLHLLEVQQLLLLHSCAFYAWAWLLPLLLLLVHHRSVLLVLLLWPDHLPRCACCAALT